MRTRLGLGAALLASACSAVTPTAPAATPATTTTTTTAPPSLPTSASPGDLAFCVTETNRYRALLGRVAVQPSPTLHTYAALAAQHDGQTHTPHDYTIHAGVPYAENEIPWWPLAPYGSVQAVLTAGIALMWAEGPNGGHYRNLTNSAVREIGCGVYIAAGEITIVQDFR